MKQANKKVFIQEQYGTHSLLHHLLLSLLSSMKPTLGFIIPLSLYAFSQFGSLLQCLMMAKNGRYQGSSTTQQHRTMVLNLFSMP